MCMSCDASSCGCTCAVRVAQRTARVFEPKSKRATKQASAQPALCDSVVKCKFELVGNVSSSSDSSKASRLLNLPFTFNR